MPAIHETKIHGKKSFPYAVYGGRLPDWLKGYPLHWHDEMEIIHMLKGTMIVSIQNEDYILNAGDTALIQPQFIHSIRQDGDKKADYFNILFRLSLLSDKNDLCAEKYIFPVESGATIIPKHLQKEDTLNITISPFIRRLGDIELSGQDGQELLIKAYLYAVMHFICTCAKPESIEEQQLRIMFEKIKKALDHVHNNYSEEISVEKAASLCNFSASHFSKMFRRLFGISFNKYLINYRLEQAAKMLSKENTGVSETAFACGFNNLSYFTRAFKEKYGATPKQLQNKLP